MQPEQQHIDSIFLAAAEKAMAAERSAYLDVACASDPELRLRVERLLAAQSKVSSFLEAPVLIGTGEEPPGAERPGTLVGPYKLLEQIGEGGMGVVWMAEQTEPIRRRVAVKVVKEGMDSRLVLARFDEAREWYEKAVQWMDKHQPKNEELRRFRAEAAVLLVARHPGRPARAGTRAAHEGIAPLVREGGQANR